MKDKQKLKRFIDSSCPFEESNYFAMEVWREERRKILDKKRYQKNRLKKKQNKILEELYDVLSGKDDEPLIDAINDIQSIIC